MSKPRTSSAVKRRYNEKTYKAVSVQIQKALVEQWEARLAEENMSKAEFIRRAMIEWLETPPATRVAGPSC